MRLISILVYDIFIGLYRLGIALASPFNHKARLWVEGRKQQQITFNKPGPGKTFWFHCASLGEFEQARPVIEAVKKGGGNNCIILTFFSPSGYEIRKNYEFADKVFYLPADTKSNAINLIEAIKPDMVLFAKYEFWFHYLDELHKRKIPTILFSSVFRKEQVFFNWYGGLFREMLQKFSLIFVQDEGSQKLLASVSILAKVAFDTRFDRVYENAGKRKLFPLVEKFKGNAQIFIAGSTWPKDEELIVRMISENVLPGFKYIIAPHNIDKAAIDSLKNACPKKTVFFSELNESNAGDAEILIVDNIGNLSSLYAYGN
ncbi:MAG: 3-deoxy-D-manno-octulosonic acid transferase, partial [Candidatus Paceibacterales bacterium]